jgi:hypothetical protein
MPAAGGDQHHRERNGGSITWSMMPQRERAFRDLERLVLD